MTDIQTVRGSGNVFRDLGEKNAALKDVKARLAAQIVLALDEGGLTVRKAEALTGHAAADFSRIRNASLGRFTVDRLMTVLDRLGYEIDIALTVRMKQAAAAPLVIPG